MKPKAIYFTDKFSLYLNGPMINPEPNDPQSSVVRMPMSAEPIESLDKLRAYMAANADAEVCIVTSDSMSYVLMREASGVPTAKHMAVSTNVMAENGLNTAYSWIVPYDAVCVICTIGQTELKNKGDKWFTPSVRAYTLIKPEGID